MGRFACLAAATGMLVACAHGPDYASVVITNRPPPPKRVHRPPPSPSPLKIWIEGRWAWDGNAWIWVSGHYTYPPYPQAHWKPGHWEKRRRGWVWVPGYWLRH